VSIAGTIGGEYAKLVFKFRDLAVERIKPISPAAVKNDQRFAAAEFPVVDGDGFRAGGVR
jgi:hypothetical protein